MPGPGFRCRFVRTTTVTRYRFGTDRWIRFYYYNDRPSLRESRAGFFFVLARRTLQQLLLCARNPYTSVRGPPMAGCYGRGENYRTYLAANTCFGPGRGGPIAIIIINNSTSTRVAIAVGKQKDGKHYGHVARTVRFFSSILIVFFLLYSSMFVR